MKGYWVRHRLLLTIILCVASAMVVGLLFAFPYIAQQANNYNAQSIYKNTEMDFIAPEPSYEQVAEAEGTNGIDKVFPFYLTKTQVSVNGMSRTTTVLLSDQFQTVGITMYNEARVIEKASAEDIFEEPLHPYTQGLLSAIPRITKERAPLSTIEGMVPNPTEYIEGCRFCPRCPKATERCRQQEPPVFEHGARQVRCWLCETETAKAASETETMGGDGNGR